MLICGIILIIISIVFFSFSFYNFKKIHNINYNIDEENKKLKNINDDLKKEKIKLETENKYLENNYRTSLSKLNIMKDTLDKEIQERKEIANKELEDFQKQIENQKIEIKNDWDYSNELLTQSYAELQKKEKLELEKVRATRTAAQQAITREKKIKENKDFYCLPCSVADRNDIQVLERVKKDLNNPRILSMLIWQTFFRTNATSLCNNVLGTKAVTGIYKITNQLTNECYIGQAVDVKKRFIEHMKCGLGIDTPKNNKLYKAMQEDGIWNFSFELLEKCPKEQLNEKERYYIELYMANDFGYNSTGGNK